MAEKFKDLGDTAASTALDSGSGTVVGKDNTGSTDTGEPGMCSSGTSSAIKVNPYESAPCKKNMDNFCPDKQQPVPKPASVQNVSRCDSIEKMDCEIKEKAKGKKIDPTGNNTEQLTSEMRAVNIQSDTIEKRPSSRQVKNDYSLDVPVSTDTIGEKMVKQESQVATKAKVYGTSTTNCNTEVTHQCTDKTKSAEESVDTSGNKQSNFSHPSIISSDCENPAVESNSQAIAKGIACPSITSTNATCTNTISTSASSTYTISTNTISTNQTGTSTISTNTISTNTSSTNQTSTSTISTNTSSTNQTSTNTISTIARSANTTSTNPTMINTSTTNANFTNLSSTNTTNTSINSTNTTCIIRSSNNTLITNTTDSSTTNTNTTSTETTSTNTNTTSPNTINTNTSSTNAIGTITMSNIFSIVLDNSAVGANKSIQNNFGELYAGTVLKGRYKPMHVNSTYGRSGLCMQESVIQQQSWTPNINVPHRSQMSSYNTLRRRKYVKTSVDKEKLESLMNFYEKKVQIDSDAEEAGINLVDNILETVLNNTFLTLRGQFANEACDEGSVSADTKVGKLDESDHSVEILLTDRDEIILSVEPFHVEYSEDDIDSFIVDEIQSTAFVCNGKRLFPNESRPLKFDPKPVDVPAGQVAVRLGSSDAARFADCCIPRSQGFRKDHGWLLPYELLHKFHRGIAKAIEISAIEGVTLNNGARGPAITLTVQQQNGPNISVDITPKLSLSQGKLNITHFKWPRKDTRKWLTKSKIESVNEELIYLVPKGDKYWKISFANLENELFDDIDDNGTWRKECLKIMKKKLIQWKSKSRAGLKGLSSYLLKTTQLWLCEILPDDKYWAREQLANRYVNFLQELEHRLKKKKLGEYFNQSVNLLEHKHDEDIEELRQFLLDEIEDFIGQDTATEK